MGGTGLQRLVAATDSSVLLTDCKQETFGLVCSELVNCENVLRLRSSNWVWNVEHCVRAFVISTVLIVSLLV